jgi:hypothetical protein
MLFAFYILLSVAVNTTLYAAELPYLLPNLIKRPALAVGQIGTYKSPMARALCLSNGLMGSRKDVPVPMTPGFTPYQYQDSFLARFQSFEAVSYFLICAAEQQRILDTMKKQMGMVNEDGSPVLDYVTYRYYKKWIHSNPWGAYNPGQAWPQAYCVANILYPLKAALGDEIKPSNRFWKKVFSSHIPDSIDTFSRFDRPLGPTKAAISYLDAIFSNDTGLTSCPAPVLK